MKTNQERINYLASRVRNFSIAVSGGARVTGGFGNIPDENVTLEHIDQAFKGFHLAGAAGVKAHGSIEKGYVLFGG